MDSSIGPTYCYDQIHIDAARNSTDDFNLFHDPKKWSMIEANPFGGPIALGFQLECLIEFLVLRHRMDHGEDTLVDEHNLRYANYQFQFADVLRAGEPFQVQIKPSIVKTGATPSISNRVVVRKESGMALIGYARHTAAPLYLADTELGELGELRELEDRSWIADGKWFLKRKFMNTGNAKNFLSGSLADQSYFFDELEDKIQFPEMVPTALISCALLEEARAQNHDFTRNPMVYTAHHISVDHELGMSLSSNDRLHMLVSPPVAVEKGNGDPRNQRQRYECFGLVHDNQVLYRAEVFMAPLAAIQAAKG